MRATVSLRCRRRKLRPAPQTVPLECHEDRVLVLEDEAGDAERRREFQPLDVNGEFQRRHQWFAPKLISLKTSASHSTDAADIISTMLQSFAGHRCCGCTVMVLVPGSSVSEGRHRPVS